MEGVPFLRGGKKPDVEPQTDETRHCGCCTGSGAALSQAEGDPLEGGIEGSCVFRATAHLGHTYYAESDVGVNIGVYVDADYDAIDFRRCCYVWLLDRSVVFRNAEMRYPFDFRSRG